MDRNQENTYSMFLAVMLYCTETTAVWTAHVPFKNAYDAFAALMPTIKSLITLQAIDRKGFAEAKKEKASFLADTVIPVIKPLVAYAFEKNDDPLRQKVDYSKSDLLKLPDSVLPETVQIIHDAATEHLVDLAPYGITAPTLTNLLAVKDDYASSIATPRTGIVERKTATEKLALKIEEANNILKQQLDNTVFFFQTTNPDFFNGYNSARIIIDLKGGAPKKPE